MSTIFPRMGDQISFSLLGRQSIRVSDDFMILSSSALYAAAPAFSDSASHSTAAYDPRKANPPPLAYTPISCTYQNSSYRRTSVSEQMPHLQRIPHTYVIHFAPENPHIPHKAPSQSPPAYAAYCSFCLSWPHGIPTQDQLQMLSAGRGARNFGGPDCLYPRPALLDPDGWGIGKLSVGLIFFWGRGRVGGKNPRLLCPRGVMPGTPGGLCARSQKGNSTR